MCCFLSVRSDDASYNGGGATGQIIIINLVVNLAKLILFNYSARIATEISLSLSAAAAVIKQKMINYIYIF